MKTFLKKSALLLLSLLMVFSNSYFISAGEENTYSAINGYVLPSNIEAVTTEGTYPWQTNNNSQTLVSGNAQVSSSVSSLKVTVKGSGALCFDYRVYSTTTAEENNPDSLVVSIGTEVTASTSYTSLTGAGALRFYGNIDWTSTTIKITAEENVTTDIYFAYKKNGSVNSAFDCALIKNLAFITTASTVTALSTDESLGTVSGGGEYFAGETVTLTATPKDNGKFFGWSMNGQRLEETSSTYSFVAGQDVTITAIFGNVNDTVAWNRKTGAIYSTLNNALFNAQANDVIELLKDTTLLENAIIPKDVTLYIPYSATYDADGNADGTTSNSPYFATTAQTYKCLTVNSGVTLTVKGELLIGGVISYPAQFYQGHTSGAHGRITNNGLIQMDGGRIDCYGFIDGNGVVNVNSGEVYEPFIVLDFAGGNNCLELYLANQNSFTEYTVQNISCTLEVEQSGCLGIYCNLYASSEFNKIQSVFVGNSTTYPTALIAFNENAKVTRTVDKTKTIPAGIIPNDNNYGADIGKTTYTITGGAILGNLHMTVYGFNISVEQFPIPYCFDFIIENGNYTMPNGWNIMPGASLH